MDVISPERNNHTACLRMAAVKSDIQTTAPLETDCHYDYIIT